MDQHRGDGTIQRLRVPRDVANAARRIQSLAAGEYVIYLTVDGDGGICWKVAELGKIERTSVR